MDWRTIKEMRFELEENGFYIEAITDEYIVLSKLSEDNGKLYYAYSGIYDINGNIKVFDFNVKEDK